MGVIVGTQTPSSLSGTGTSARASLLSGHIFNAGLEQPEILKSLIVKFPNFWFSDLLESIPDVSGEIESDVFSWQVLDRTRKSATLTYVSGTGTATIVVDTDIAQTESGSLGYFLVGDTVRVANTGSVYVISAVADAGSVQRISLQNLDGSTTIAQADVDGYKIGHIGTAFARGSSASGGTRVSLPGNDYNVTTIQRRGWTIERGVLSQKTYVDDTSWYFKQEDIEQKEFMRDFQATLLFGKRSLNRDAKSNMRGIMEYAEGSGQNVTFSGAVGVQEADWISLTEALLPQQGSDDLVVLMGEKIFLQNQAALGDRYRSIPNSEKPAQLAGLNFESYSIGNKRFHFKYFDMFSDTAILPTVTANGTAKDFRNLALVLDLGNIPGAGRNIQVKYRKGAKFIQKAIPGMASPGMEAASAYDGLQMELLSEFTCGCMLPNRLGLVYSVS
jgi:hypothetical protein